MNGALALARLMGRYVSANVQSALEYRTSLVSQALGMALTDVMWVTFWSSYFDRFRLPGWERADVVTLWAVVCASYGLANTLCGNSVKLAEMISRGEMDFYLALPKPVLPHALVSRMYLIAPGDFVFGFLAFGLYAQPSALHWALFAVCTVTGAVILISFCVLAASLAFWLGNAEGVFGQLYGAITSFSTFPTSIFQGPVRILLFTILPAGFIATVPVELLRAPNWSALAELLCVAAGFAWVSTKVFALGLRRYTSGNLMVLRD
jgi:ABC-2 type transport system permease protein